MKAQHLLVAALFVGACGGTDVEADPAQRDGGTASTSDRDAGSAPDLMPSGTVVFTPVGAGQAATSAHRVRLTVGTAAVRGASSSTQLRYVLKRSDHR